MGNDAVGPGKRAQGAESGPSGRFGPPSMGPGADGGPWLVLECRGAPSGLTLDMGSPEYPPVLCRTLEARAEKAVRFVTGFRGRIGLAFQAARGEHGWRVEVSPVSGPGRARGMAALSRFSRTVAANRGLLGSLVFGQ